MNLKVNLRRSLILGIFIWVFALILATIVMVAIGVDFDEPDFEFGPDHEKYWQFQMIIIPSFLILSFLVFFYYYRTSEVDHQFWMEESFTFGIIVMLIQFILDTIVLVILAGSGIDYFYAMVTISYLSIPLWSLLAGYLLKRP